jgi:hypothetical protein
MDGQERTPVLSLVARRGQGPWPRIRAAGCGIETEAVYPTLTAAMTAFRDVRPSRVAGVPEAKEPMAEDSGEETQNE